VIGSRHLVVADDVVAVRRDAVAAGDRAHEQRRAAVLRIGVVDAVPRIELMLDADAVRVRDTRVVRGVGLGDELQDPAAPRLHEVVRADARARVLEPVDGREPGAGGLVDDDLCDGHRPADVVVRSRGGHVLDGRVIGRRGGKRRRRRGERKSKNEDESGGPTHLQERATYLAAAGCDKVPGTDVLSAKQRCSSSAMA